MKKAIIISGLIVSFFFGSFCFAEEPPVPLGVWVTVFSGKRPLYSKEGVEELVNTCKESGINEIYLQVYQSGKAFYDSALFEHSKYLSMAAGVKADPIDYLLKLAKKNNIKVFAWVNLLSLSQNESADIIDKFGSSVLTRDQHLRPSGRKNPNAGDKFYLREEQLFLEPGDPRVARFLLAVVSDIIKRYPGIDGIHLDYARYPMTVPFIPGSKFTQFGLSYGFGEKNVEHFKEATGIDPVSGLKTEENFSAWDNWRRDQISLLVKRITKFVKRQSQDYLVSCAVVPSFERAYSSMFQDWALWLEEGYVDYVVLMNYTNDSQLTKRLIRSGLAQRGRGRVFAGIGAFLLKSNPDAFKSQFNLLKSEKPDGITVFSYDDLTSRIKACLKN